MKLIEITSIEYKNTSKNVYDIEVKEKHQYCANGYFVHNCTTAANVGIHYPTATLLDELRMEKERYEVMTEKPAPTQIIADGGIANFDDIQKCLTLGADFVMSGSIFAKSWEACSEVVYMQPTNLNMMDAIPEKIYKEKIEWLEKTLSEMCQNYEKYKDDIEQINESLNKMKKRKPYREYYGMSTKRAQKETGGSGNTTAEGISRPIPIEYNINKWADNMKSFLVSVMSYTDSLTLKNLVENTKMIINLSGDRQYRK